MRSDRFRCFTLVELLIVVAILLLLMSILIPSMRSARRSARRVVCMTNLHTLGIGVHCYQTEFAGILPWEGYAEGDRPIRHVGPWEDPSQWFNATPAYAGYSAYCELQRAAIAGGKPLPRDGDRSLFVCPDSAPAVAGFEDDLVEDGYFMLWGTDLAGIQLDRRKTFWSYAYNTKLDAMVEDRHERERVSLSIEKVGCTSEVPILVEKLMRPDEIDPPFPTSVGQAATAWSEFTTRHRGGGFLLFLDNHVGYLTRAELVNAPHAPMDYNQPGKVIWNPGGPIN